MKRSFTCYCVPKLSFGTRSWTFVFGLVIFLFFSSSFAQMTGGLPFEIELQGDLKGFQSELIKEEVSKDIHVITLKLSSSKRASPPKCTLFWKIPIVDITTQWTTSSHQHKFLYPNWSGRAGITSRATNHAPVVSLLNNQDENRLTFACSDALNTIRLNTGVKEEDGHFYCEVRFFTEKHPPLRSHEVQVRIDLRPCHFSRSLREVADWWASLDAYRPSPIPEHARLPMYSTWYSFHQNLVVDEVLDQCRRSKALGYEAVIVDDGWQTLDSNRGYLYTGDWWPERIPDMAGFVDAVHDIGMKFILWYSVPFIGDSAKNASRFQGKYLSHWGGEWGGSSTLDPRYPEVREFLIQTYEDALRDWDLDGFKLDFVDDFVADEKTVLDASDGRDYASVNRAVDRLMTDIMKRLRAIKPDVLIEFRQSYIGPLMRKYGNMFRAGDCPESAHYNRIRITDLRLLSGNTPTHSDMLMWHPDEPVESAALQLLHVLFSVPQLSVRLEKIPEDHIQMVQFWTDYWLENRVVLLEGEFIPFRPAMNYPLIIGRTQNKTIVGVYEDMVVPFDGKAEELHFINGKGTETIVLSLAEDWGEVRMKVIDCRGQSVQNIRINMMRGLHSIQVPPSGLVKLVRVQY